MKWKLAIIVCSYVIGVGFIAVWYIEVEKRILNPPNRHFEINSIKWMLDAGYVFLSIGSTVLVHLIARPIGMFLWHRGKSDRM
jgi:hypothetical protein